MPVTHHTSAAHAVIDRMTDAWRRRDAAAWAAEFIPAASMVVLGQHWRSQDEILAAMRRGFAGPYADAADVRIAVVDVRSVGESVMVLLTEGGPIPRGATEPDPLVLATWMLVRADDGWRIAAYHNSRQETLTRQ